MNHLKILGTGILILLAVLNVMLVGAGLVFGLVMCCIRYPINIFIIVFGVLFLILAYKLGKEYLDEN